jgi:dienelactone hydrolase
MPRSLKFGAAACLVLFVACVRMLSTLHLWPSWSNMAASFPASVAIVLPSSLNPPPANDPDPLPPAPSTSSAIFSTVSIPSVSIPLASAPSAGLPSVLTPGSSGGVVVNASTQPIQIPRMPTGSLPGILAVPAGKGPFPAVIMLHGCNGPFPAPPRWAYRLTGWGYAVLMPDSMTPRGVTNVCDPADQPKVTAWDRVGDIGAAAYWLRTQPQIDPNRIAVLGFSHGGATAALAVQLPYSAIRLRAAIDYYGPCVEPQQHGSVPLLVLAGEADDWGNPAERCRTYGKALRKDQPFEMYSYPGAFHGFDSGPIKKTEVLGHTLVYDRAAAEDSFARVRGFLDRQVKP